METKSIVQKEKKYKPGNIVIHKKHNNKVCVRGYNKANEVVCNWFDEKEQLHEESFNENELQLISH
jgi:uncharacterized protein YodC (DUF2158 family)